MTTSRNKIRELTQEYKKLFPEDTILEFYGPFGVEVLRGLKVFPLSKKFFFMVEKVGLPQEKVEALVLKTLEYYLGEKIDKETLYKAETVPHVRELPLEEYFSEKEVQILKEKKRCPQEFFEKIKEIFGIEPLVKDYAKDFYRWKNGEFRLFGEEEWAK